MGAILVFTFFSGGDVPVIKIERFDSFAMCEAVGTALGYELKVEHVWSWYCLTEKPGSGSAVGKPQIVWSRSP